MKKLSALCILFFSISSFAQEYLAPVTKGVSNLIGLDKETGFNYCQYNQNILYKKTLQYSSEQIQLLLEKIDAERSLDNKSFRLEWYVRLLQEKVFFHIEVPQV